MATRAPRPAPPQFEDAAAARAALTRLGPRLEGVEPVVVFRPPPPPRRRPAR